MLSHATSRCNREAKKQKHPVIHTIIIPPKISFLDPMSAMDSVLSNAATKEKSSFTTAHIATKLGNMMHWRDLMTTNFVVDDSSKTNKKSHCRRSEN